MADEQNPNDPRYDWLYSGQSGPGREGDSAEAGDTNDGADPDATQMISRRDARGGDASDDAAEHTRVLGSQPRPEDTSSAGAQTFGGTYDRPQRESPRFAEPSQAGGGGQQSGARTSYAPPPKRRKRRRWWLRGIITVIILWLIFLVATPIYAWSKISQVDADPGGNRPADTPGTTYLLVGSDSREGLTKAEQNDLGTGAAAGQRTDTIILLHVTSGDGPNVMLSIPRDSYVDIPGHGKGKINASFAYGGADLLVQTVERATDVRVDDYIEIGFGGVVDTVDAVGGITVCPK
ncbi:MAG: LCP family protein, partial [Nocardioidaceae bacterium]